MKILILEGIPTSGKSTVAEDIRKLLPGLIVRIATEAETHESIMEQTNDLHISFFEELIKRLLNEKSDFIIFDRLYLTQAFRAGARLTEYSAIENLLAQYGALTVFLKVDEQTIAGRIAKAAKNRDSSGDTFKWDNYFKTKGNSYDEIAEYYIVQQNNQLKLLSSSSLPHMICDSTHHNYPEIAQKILKEIQLK